MNIEYADVDLERKERTGVPEVIYGAGKTVPQIEGIMKVMIDAGQFPIMITRLSEEKEKKLSETFKGELKYFPQAAIAVLGEMREPDGDGTVLVMTGGTSDISVAEEAALTAEILGNRVKRVYDVGVAGIHRLLKHQPDIDEARVIIAVAGMEGALASVVAGLSKAPVIAVPTSVGYGASFNGISALLSMLNSCASGVSVVNIDNGFGAGFQASLINHSFKGGKL